MAEIIGSLQFTIPENLALRAIKDRFDDLKESENFQKSVTKFRSDVGIPTDGISWDGWHHLVSRNWNEGKARRLKHYCRKVFKEHNLPAYLEYPLRGYFLYGEHQPEKLRFYVGASTETPGCSLEFANDSALIVIHSGATKNDVLRALQIWWPMINLMLKPVNGSKSKRFKTRHKKSRDKRVFELYEKAIIGYDGQIKVPKASEYLRTRGVTTKVNLVEAFRGVGIDLPKSREARRKIIQKFKRLKRA